MQFSIAASFLALGSVSQVLAYPSFSPENGLVGRGEIEEVGHGHDIEQGLTSSEIEDFAHDLELDLMDSEIEEVGPNEWIAPTKDDARSPCPMLNSLANHGYLPRNGRDISLSQLYKVLWDVTHVDVSGVNYLGAKKALGISSTKEKWTFNLNDLNTYNVIEHDCSLSRANFQSGNNWSFDAGIWSTVRDFFTTPLVSTKQLGRAIRSRQDADPLNDPLGVLTEEASLRSVSDAAVLWLVFRNGEGANRLWINTLVEKERLPFAEGWILPPLSIDSADILEVATAITYDTILESDHFR
ncbi:putative sterigmatocystin biosynthesis peroxidase stcC [Ceratocystis fimbriata CBS 114723]|uniref:Putative sterigmatocystin biosynthesis peroxidase stcC n=1 Tax=Ceratocystis fimbriata CBS 114723 TaxID=1035309 RepID=A0A2C5WZ13_9PEZI|nr:putative sterigmatocystin biosynthesis peroxidase stcC [Ceratocystis fimbriata CBS 114723]